MLQWMQSSTPLLHHSMSHKAAVLAPVKVWSSSKPFMWVADFLHSAWVHVCLCLSLLTFDPVTQFPRNLTGKWSFQRGDVPVCFVKRSRQILEILWMLPRDCLQLLAPFPMLKLSSFLYLHNSLCGHTAKAIHLKKPQIAINWKNQTNNSNTQNSPSRAKRSISNWIRSWSGSLSVYTIHKRESYGEDRDIWAEKSLGWHCYQWNGYGTMPKGQRWSACSSLEITEVTWEKLCEYFNMRKSFS